MHFNCTLGQLHSSGFNILYNYSVYHKCTILFDHLYTYSMHYVLQYLTHLELTQSKYTGSYWYTHKYLALYTYGLVQT